MYLCKAVIGLFYVKYLHIACPRNELLCGYFAVEQWASRPYIPELTTYDFDNLIKIISVHKSRQLTLSVIFSVHSVCFKLNIF